MKKYENPSINISEFESENIAATASIPPVGENTLDATQTLLGVASDNTFNLVF